VVETDELEMLGELSGLDQIVEGRNDQAFGKIARRAEDHHGARRRRRGAFGLLRAFCRSAAIRPVVHRRPYFPLAANPRCSSAR
jgi:hypothetical protein